MICQILGLLANTWAADDRYPVPNRENLMIPIEMQLSQKQKTFADFFSAFLKSTLNFEDLKKKGDPHRFCASEISDFKIVIR